MSGGGGRLVPGTGTSCWVSVEGVIRPLLFLALPSHLCNGNSHPQLLPSDPVHPANKLMGWGLFDNSMGIRGGVGVGAMGYVHPPEQVMGDGEKS